MLKMRRSIDRGHADHGWLKSAHSFSFASYYDPENMGFSDLRVINEDQIAGGSGFGTHGHQDMEIISYVIDGGLEHRDTMGNQTTILPGDVQIMSAGTGVRHSEMNHFRERITHFLQIWVLPQQKGLLPSYGQKSFLQAFEGGRPVLVVSPDGERGSLKINQDVKIWIGKAGLAGEEEWTSFLKRKGWIQVVRGTVKVDRFELGPGDGLAIANEESLKLQWSSQSEFLIFDLPE